MLAYQIVDDVVSVPSKMLFNHPLILEKLNDIAKECGTEFYPCGSLLQQASACVDEDALSKSYVMMKLIDVGHLKISGDLDAQADKITAYCVIVTDGRHTETYDLCGRRVKDMSSLLRGISTIKGVKVVSLDIHSTGFDDKLPLYAKFGFGKPTLIDDEPYYGHTPYTKVKLSSSALMLVNDGNVVDEKRVVSDSYLLIKANVKMCQVVIHIRPQLVSHLLKYTLRDVEYSGMLFLTKQDGISAPVVSYDTRTETKGSPVPLYIAPIPNATMSFHSHPAVCDTDTLLCYVAWPTADDMVAVVNGYLSTSNPMYIHIVATSAGIYFVRLNPLFQRLLLGLTKIDRERVVRVIRKKFSNNVKVVEERKPGSVSYAYMSCPATAPPAFSEPVEGDSNVFIDVSNNVPTSELFYDNTTPDIQSVFLTTAHSLMFEDLLIQRASMTDDFPLFKVDFVHIDNVSTLKNNVVIKYYGKCPLEITNIPETNIIY